MDAIRTQILTTSRTFLGTPFQLHGRIKGVGIDCAGLCICVGRELGLFPSDFDLTGYGNLPVGMHETLKQYCPERQIQDREPGDILLLRIRTDDQHAAIMTDLEGGGMIHSLLRYSVAEHVIDEGWKKRITAVFKFPGVE